MKYMTKRVPISTIVTGKAAMPPPFRTRIRAKHNNRERPSSTMRSPLPSLARRGLIVFGMQVLPLGKTSVVPSRAGVKILLYPTAATGYRLTDA